MKCLTLKLNNRKLASLSRSGLELFENISYSYDNFADHRTVFNELKKYRLYSITIIIESLKPGYYLRKKYVEKRTTPIQSKYQELLFKFFFDEFGNLQANKIYADFLDKYRNSIDSDEDIDEYIIKKELEPRYRGKIFKQYKNIEKLMASRVRIDRERYYNLPEPLNRLDWRNPYDNIFVWEKEGKKYCVRGGSGSSGQREKNSKFIYGLGLINKIKQIPSYLFIYNDENELKLIKKFNHLTVPTYDIGLNYSLKPQESRKILNDISLLEWSDFFKVKTIRIY